MNNPSPSSLAPRRTKLAPLKTSLAYLLYGMLWILFSDRLAAIIASSEEQLLVFSNIKGWLFIVITALLLYLVLFRDAKKIKTRELQLANSAEHLKAAQSTARLGSWEQDAQTDALAWSDTVYDLFGVDPKKTSFTTEQFLDLVHPDDQEHVKNAFANSLDQAGPAYDLTHRIIRADTGAVRFMHEHCTHFRDAEGHITKSIGTVQDITNQVVAEAHVKNSAALMKRTESIAHVGSWQLDLKTNCLTWSEEAYRVFGIPPEKFDGTYEAFLEIVHPDDRERINSAYTSSIRDGRDDYEVEHRVVWPDGSVRHVHEKCVHERDAKGAIIRSIGFCHDITERIQAQQELEESEEKYRALFNNAPLSYQSLNEDGCFIDVNPAWLRVLGYDREEVIGKWFGDFLHPDFVQHFATNFPAFKKRGYVKDVQFRIRHKNGTYRHIEFEGCIGYLPDGSFRQTYCVFMDITERKLAEERLATSEERLRLALNAASQGLYDLNVQTGECTVSSEYATMLGYDPATYVENMEAWLERIHPDDVERTVGFYQDYIDGKVDQYRVEFRQRTASGDWLWILSCGKIVEYDVEGQPLRMLGTHTNITESKRTQKALLESEKKLGEWLAFSPICTKILDLDFNLNFMSEAGVQALKVKDVTQLYGKPYPFDFFPESFNKSMLHALQQAKTTGEVSKNVGWVSDPDGNDICFSATINPVKDDKGELDYIMVTSTDITERKRNEERLSASEERFRSICERAPVLIDGFDETGRCTLWNEQCRKTFGWTFEEISAHPNPLELFYPDPDVRDDMLKSITIQPDEQFREWYPSTKDGQTLTTLWANLCLPDGQVYSIGQDITENRRMEQKLANHHAELEKEVDERTQELRTIVNAMAGREVRMAELKEEIDDLKAQLNKKAAGPLN
jgi:PAS domain S-box-containing protein